MICCVTVTVAAARNCLETNQDFNIFSAQPNRYADVLDEQPVKRTALHSQSRAVWSEVEKLCTHLYTRCAVTSGTWRIREKGNPKAAVSHFFTPSGRTCCQSPQRNVTIMSCNKRPADCGSGPCRCGSRRSASRRWMRCFGRHPLPDLWDSAPTFPLSLSLDEVNSGAWSARTGDEAVIRSLFAWRAIKEARRTSAQRAGDRGECTGREF